MRISTGVTVNVSANTERWLSEIRAGRAFAGNLGQAQVAAQNSHVQLFNPVGSGVTVLVRSLFADPTGASGVAMAHYNTALTTLGGNGRNMLSGGAASVAELRSQTNVGILGNIFFAQDFPTLDVRQVSNDWVTELGAGEGLLFALGVVNTVLSCSFTWIEV